MPELPDVENYCRYLRRTSLHKPIRAIEVGNTKILRGVSGKRLGQALRGRSLEDTRRHGKNLFVATGENGWLALHFGMTGRLRYFKRLEDDPQHDRLRIDFANGYHLAFDEQRMLGWVRLIDDPDAFVKEHALGPDALDAVLKAEAFATRLSDRRGGLKAALMDQTLFAGIGNVYSDEILFQARLHPNRKVHDLSGTQVRELYETTRRVLKMAIDKGAGVKDVENRLPSGYLLPHRQKGASCPRCGGKVQSLKSAGRTAYFCARCQAAP